MYDTMGPVVSRLLAESIANLVQAGARAIKKTLRRRRIVRLTSIGDFWEQRQGPLEEGVSVCIAGALSQYGPLVIGSPKRKRYMHREFRRNIPQMEATTSATTIDALLAYTAGQMVMRLGAEETPFVYMGLYHSIVRNSIPVFVGADYYKSVVSGYFARRTAPRTIEAEVTGRLKLISQDFFGGLLDELTVGGIISPGILKGSPGLALEVDGPETGTEIKYCGEARYLDGDIWVAVQSHDEQRFISRFLDLSDMSDLRQEREELRGDVEQHLKGGDVIAEFDQVDRIFSGFQTLDPDEVIRRAMGAS